MRENKLSDVILSLKAQRSENLPKDRDHLHSLWLCGEETGSLSLSKDVFTEVSAIHTAALAWDTQQWGTTEEQGKLWGSKPREVKKVFPWPDSTRWVLWQTGVAILRTRVRPHPVWTPKASSSG